MHPNKETPLPNMYLLMRGLRSISSNDRATIQFNSSSFDGKEVDFLGVTVRVDQIGGAYRHLVQAAEEGLNKLLLDNHPNFWLDSKAKIWDDTWKLTSGYCFLDHEQNPWRGRKSLEDLILQDPTLSERFARVGARGQFCWKSKQISAWLQDAYDIQRLLFLGFFISFGEPGRGSEMESLLLRNVPGGTIREVFVLVG